MSRNFERGDYVCYFYVNLFSKLNIIRKFKFIYFAIIILLFEIFLDN